MHYLTIGFCLVSSFGLVGACQDPTPPSSTPAVAVGVAKAQVAKVVFIDKAIACDCTKKRTEDSFAALTTALGTPASLPVERIHLDTQKAQADTYTVFKPLLVVPGIYFLDANNAVVELLQGEVQAEQVTMVLKGG